MKSKYEVLVKFTLTEQITVEADNEPEAIAEAEQKIESQYLEYAHDIEIVDISKH